MEAGLKNTSKKGTEEGFIPVKNDRGKMECFFKKTENVLSNSLF